MRNDPLQLATTALLAIALALMVPLPSRSAGHASAVDCHVEVVDGLTHDSISFAGLVRTFAYRVPPSGARGAPVVVALHGGGGSADRLRTFIGEPLESHAAEHGIVVVYPNGIGGSWNDCRAGAPYAANTRAIDDVGFLRALVQHLSATSGVDATRVFALGLSNGAHLALRLAVDAPDLIGGVVSFAATWPPSHASDCRLTQDGRPAPGGHAVPGPHVAMPESVAGPIARAYDGVGEALAFFLRQKGG